MMAVTMASTTPVSGLDFRDVTAESARFFRYHRDGGTVFARWTSFSPSQVTIFLRRSGRVGAFEGLDRECEQPPTDDA